MLAMIASMARTVDRRVGDVVTVLFGRVADPLSRDLYRGDLYRMVFLPYASMKKSNVIGKRY